MRPFFVLVTKKSLWVVQVRRAAGETYCQSNIAPSFPTLLPSCPPSFVLAPPPCWIAPASCHADSWLPKSTKCNVPWLFFFFIPFRLFCCVSSLSAHFQPGVVSRRATTRTEVGGSNIAHASGEERIMWYSISIKVQRGRMRLTPPVQKKKKKKADKVKEINRGNGQGIEHSCCQEQENTPVHEEHGNKGQIHHCPRMPLVQVAR